tara:strand:- start:80 stop:262 length:183 start_codon:yes stop_codon:yes gene_type:complete
MLKIKPGDLVKNTLGTKRHGIILANIFSERDWFYVLCNGRKQRWHISNIDLVHKGEKFHE